MFSRFLYAVACREVSFLKKDKFLPIMESELWSAFFLFQPLISGLWNLHKGTKKTFWSYLLRLTQSFEHLEAFPGCLRSPKRVRVLFSFFFQLFWHYGLTCCYLQSKWLKNLTLRHYGRHQKHFFFFCSPWPNICCHFPLVEPGRGTMCGQQACNTIHVHDSCISQHLSVSLFSPLFLKPIRTNATFILQIFS
jgi:hypothetical protein